MSNEYTPFAIQAIHNLFPNRNIAVVGGDSGVTVPNARWLMNEHKCNLIFIDGGHKDYHLINDIVNMKELADRNYNRVIVDDLDFPALKEVWNYFLDVTSPVAQQLSVGLRSIDYVVSPMRKCIDWKWDENMFIFNYTCEDPSLSSDTVGHIGIAEYIF